MKPVVLIIHMRPGKQFQHPELLKPPELLKLIERIEPLKRHPNVVLRKRLDVWEVDLNVSVTQQKKDVEI